MAQLDKYTVFYERRDGQEMQTEVLAQSEPDARRRVLKITTDIDPQTVAVRLKEHRSER